MAATTRLQVCESYLSFASASNHDPAGPVTSKKTNASQPPPSGCSQRQFTELPLSKPGRPGSTVSSRRRRHGEATQRPGAPVEFVRPRLHSVRCLFEPLARPTPSVSASDPSQGFDEETGAAALAWRQRLRAAPVSVRLELRQARRYLRDIPQAW
jgi:hypothetical protein